jgi:hypothetical protein
MSLPRNQSLGPHRTGDSFTVRRVRLSADAEQLLLLAIPFNAAVNTFQSELNRWNASTPVRQMRPQAARVARATRAFISGLKAVQWPQRVKPLALKLIDALRRQVIATQPDALPAPADIATWRQAWDDNDAIANASTPISSLLNVPNGAKLANH